MSCRAYLGRCGSGKTFALQLSARAAIESSAWSVLVLDAGEEWPSRDAWRGSSVSARVVHSAERAAAALASGCRLVIVRAGSASINWSAPSPLAPLADELALVAIDCPRPVVLVLPEAHQVAREGYPLPPQIGRIAHRWRHLGALLWVDTQNPADVKKELLRAVPELWQFAPGGWQDFTTLRQVGGPSLERAGRALVGLVTAETRAGRDGRGWHIRATPGEDPSSWWAYRVDPRGKVEKCRLV